jgi:hypothetical protein
MSHSNVRHAAPTEKPVGGKAKSKKQKNAVADDQATQLDMPLPLPPGDAHAEAAICPRGGQMAATDPGVPQAESNAPKNEDKTASSIDLDRKVEKLKKAIHVKLAQIDAKENATLHVKLLAGRHLLEVQAILGGRKFKPWLEEAKFERSRSWCYKAMGAAEAELFLGPALVWAVDNPGDYGSDLQGVINVVEAWREANGIGRKKTPQEGQKPKPRSAAEEVKDLRLALTASEEREAESDDRIAALESERSYLSEKYARLYAMLQDVAERVASNKPLDARMLRSKLDEFGDAVPNVVEE